MDNPTRVGIDVSAKSLSVAWRGRSKDPVSRAFPNSPAGHKRLLRQLPSSRPLHVALEATGIYHLDVALALASAEGVSVMVVNPKASHNFGQAMLARSKTDAVDAALLLQYCERMPWQAWNPPSPTVLQLRTLCRHAANLRKQLAAERTRLKRAQATEQLSQWIQADIELGISQLSARADNLQAQAEALIASDAELSARYALLCTVPGIAGKSGAHLLSELSLLPADMSAKQWVAHVGLDPRRLESGTSVRGRVRISKQGNRYVRQQLYMPALVAIQHSPEVRGFYESLVGRGKPRMSAVVAVMRKLLHAVWGMLRHGSAWDGSRFFRLVDTSEQAGCGEPAPAELSSAAEGHSGEVAAEGGGSDAEGLRQHTTSPARSAGRAQSRASPTGAAAERSASVSLAEPLTACGPC